MSDSFFDQLGAVEAVYSELDSVVEFLESNKSRYIALARNTISDVLGGLRPEGIEEDAWERRVRSIQRGVLLEVMATGKGFDLSYGGGRQADVKEGLSDEIEYEDVMEWVEAGLRGDAEGKDIANYEADRTKEQIAMNVYEAISQPGLSAMGKDYTGVRSAIEEYFSSEVSTGLSGFMEIILNAWSNVFLVVVTRDYAEWLEKKIMQSL